MTLEPTYRQAVSHAWKFAWHHKMVWIAGLLSVFVGQMGLSNFVGQLVTKLFTDDAYWPKQLGVMHIVSGEQLFWFSWTMFLVAALILFVLVAAVCAQATLMVMAISWYRTRTVPSLTRAWHVGSKHFWSVLAINVLEKISLSAVLSSVVISVTIFSNSTAGLLGQILVVAAGLFLALVISTVAIYALAYTVVDSVPVVKAVGRAYALFKRHLLVSLELAALLLAFNAVFVAALSFALMIALVVPALLTVVAGFKGGYADLLVLSVPLYFFVLTFIMAVLGAIFNTFTTSAWMFFFLKMHHEGLVSRIMHHIAKKI